MTTADWAFIISIISAIVSAAGFIWNVWSKFIYPKSRADESYSYITAQDAYLRSLNDEEDIATAIAISLRITNLGPSDLTLWAAALGKLRWHRWRLQRYASDVPSPIHNFPTRPYVTIGPFGGEVQRKLAAGDHFVLYFKPDLDLSKHRYIGFQDTFARNHWARIKSRGHHSSRATDTRLTRTIRHTWNILTIASL
jgi:hypothetical protein